MSSESLALGILASTLALALIIDRGVPNMMESAAFALETASRWLVAGLRRNAARLRERHRRIEMENQRRLEMTAAIQFQVDPYLRIPGRASIQD
jgi:hypothetical protein